MEILKLRYFVCVAESSSMQQAAEQLHVSQATLSVAVKQLERELEVRLFQKKGRRLVLTEAGRVFLVEAKGILSQVELARQHMKLFQSQGGGAVSVLTEAPDFTNEASKRCLDEAGHSRFLQSRPDRRSIKSMLRTGQGELAVTMTDDSDSQTVSELLLDEPMLLLVNREHQLAGKESIDFCELGPETLISLPRGYGFWRLCQSFFDQKGIPVNRVYEVRDPESIPTSVAFGFGVGFIPESTYWDAARAIREICAIRVNDAFCRRRLYLTRLRERALRPEVQDVCEFLRRYAEELEDRSRLLPQRRQNANFFR